MYCPKYKSRNNNVYMYKLNQTMMGVNLKVIEPF